ncbi:hypothetical protein CC86DRAFT_367081 [Ophiobolus disseminans]|uniref:MYND-type domain-containing protein n=1 Tax=Ophiobolus disseminans TaxID=1469910 RepID=A0A6A7AEX0_9PLEO|nr:hypothetical protein CC86DRAFT_367081 [Ophiobolus disseminans]
MAICEVCPNQGVFRCTGCAESHYCSVLCQKKSWFDHKHLCKSFNDFRTAPSTTDDNQSYIRAIYFPADTLKPRFEWLKVSSINGTHTRVNLGPLLALTPEERASTCYEAAGWDHVNTAIGLDRYMPHTIRVHYRTDATEPNKCIQKNTDTRSPFLHQWNGPVIAYGIKTFTLDSHPKDMVDLAPADTREVINFFNTYLLRNPADDIRSSGPSPSPMDFMASLVTKKALEMVQCVRVNCDGETEAKGGARCQVIRLPIKHAIFTQAPVAASERFGQALVAARIPGSVEMWEGGRSKNVAVERIVAKGSVGEDGVWVGEEEVPDTWRDSVGSFIVARRDTKDVSVDEVAGLL